MKISLYNGNITSVEKPDEDITVNDFLNNVRFGKWKQQTEAIQAIKDKKKRNEAKKKSLPYVTLGGTFRTRRDADIAVPSGLIGLDFDDIPSDELDNFVEAVRSDPYTFAVFRSVSGTGCCIVVKIDSTRFLDSFLALEKYYIDSFGRLCDVSCKNISRARFVSFDPDTFQNDKAKLFKNYLPKKPAPKPPEIIYTKTDFDSLIGQIKQRGVDLTNSSYERFFRIAFGLINEFGDTATALAYFHAISSASEKYRPETTEKQFRYCARSLRQSTSTGGPTTTIATVFYYAKEAGLELVSKETQVATVIARQAKKSGRDEADTLKGLMMSGVKEEDAEKIIDLVSSSADDLRAGDDVSLIGQLELFLRGPGFNLKRNLITRQIENKGQVLETRELNSIYIQAKRIVDEKVNFLDLEKLINSDFTPDYNPLLDFFDTYRSRNETGLIKKLADSIKTDTGGEDKDYTCHFLTKWLVGVIAAVHGHHSPLLLALTGRQNSGKTEFFRRLLPAALRPYYGESKLDAGKDDELLMTQKLLIMDDELGGKSKRDEKRLKELTSKDVFSLREPYGKKNVDLKRLAVLCGTSNEMGLLSDPTGNRRIIPVNVLGIDHEAYNSIDKVTLLLEAFHLFQGGYDWQLNREDVKRLNGSTGEFEQANSEAELILKYYSPPEEGSKNLIFLTATDILVELQASSNLRLNLNRLGAEMQRLGFVRTASKFGAAVKRGYRLQRTGFQPPEQFMTRSNEQPAEVKGPDMSAPQGKQLEAF